MRRLCALILCLAMTLLCGSLQAAAANSTYTDLIEDVLARYESADRSANGAPQQQVNGAYRCFELLSILALEKDYTGGFEDVYDSIWKDCESGNNSASGAPQQLVNGLYRCVDMATVLAYEMS